MTRYELAAWTHLGWPSDHQLRHYPAGQSYVAWGPVQTDYDWANHYATQLQGSDHIGVMGKTRYYEISFNHRIAYVDASDVTLSFG